MKHLSKNAAVTIGQHAKPESKTPTAIIRGIMKQHGKLMIYTNKHKTCRSVKCYGTQTDDKELIAHLTTTLFSMGVDPSFSFNYTFGNGSYSGGPAIIVRLPMDNTPIIFGKDNTPNSKKDTEYYIQALKRIQTCNSLSVAKDLASVALISV